MIEFIVLEKKMVCKSYPWGLGRHLITKEKMLREIHQRTKADANVGNVEN